MSEPERESMEVDVLFVGAGPATLSSAYHLMKQVEAHNEACEKTGQDPIEPPTVLVIEKAAGIGDHQLSGGVMNPKAIGKPWGGSSAPRGPRGRVQVEVEHDQPGSLDAGSKLVWGGIASLSTTPVASWVPAFSTVRV